MYDEEERLRPLRLPVVFDGVPREFVRIHEEMLVERAQRGERFFVRFTPVAEPHPVFLPLEGPIPEKESVRVAQVEFSVTRMAEGAHADWLVVRPLTPADQAVMGEHARWQKNHREFFEGVIGGGSRLR